MAIFVRPYQHNSINRYAQRILKLKDTPSTIMDFNPLNRCILVLN